MNIKHWLRYQLRCKIRFHLWTYGGKEVVCSDKSYCIIGTRICVLCYLKQRWCTIGKSRWLNE